MFRPFSRRLLEGVGDAPTAPQPQPPPQSDEPEDDFPGKKHMAEEINRLRSELAKRDAVDADRKSKAEKAAEAARLKKLEEEGNYKDAIKAKDDKIASMEADFAKREREWALRAGLAGMNDLALRGAIASCPEEADVDEYVAQIKKDHESLFEGGQPSRETPDGKPSFKGGGPTGLRERAANNDPDAQKEIFNRVLQGKPY